uniref:Protein takeout n=2 Tax=Culex pipiens TaxID=7175 RepID=A0A8D8DKS3_CULPI
MSPVQSSVILASAIVLSALVSVVNSALPSQFKLCSRNDPKVEQCIISAVDHIRKNLAEGDFGEGFDVPKLEPLYVEQMKMQRGQDFQAVFNKVNVYGASTFKIDRLQSKPSNLSFDLVTSIPKLNVTGKYSLKMKLLFLELQGKGDIKGMLTNTKLSIKIRGYTETNKTAANGTVTNGTASNGTATNGTASNGTDSKQYVRFNRLGIRLKIEGGRFQLDNLFNGDPVLGQVGNQVINDNSRLFLDELIPGLERNLSRLFTEIVNNLLRTATIDEMFPEKV